MLLSILLESGMVGWNFWLDILVIPRQCTGTLATAFPFVYVFIYRPTAVLDTGLYLD